MKEETPGEPIRPEVFAASSIIKLADIIVLVREIARLSYDNFHEEIVGQYGQVRRFLSHPLNTIKFSAGLADNTILNACDCLSREFSSRLQYFNDALTEMISQPNK